MDLKLSEKFDRLSQIIKQYTSAIVAFSGGTDSTLLAFAAKQALGENTLLVTATSPVHLQSEYKDAINYSGFLQMKLEIIQLDIFDIPDFVSNPSNRCYHCKKKLFTIINQLASQKNISVVFDGSNASDNNDYRPGKKAADELGIISPLALADITKADIYALSGHFNLPTASKQSMACLASRFPYGETITLEKLNRVEKSEEQLHEMGFSQLRIRSHGDLARLELTVDEMEQAFSKRIEIADMLRKNGFTWCCLDLQGYRTGAINEMLQL